MLKLSTLTLLIVNIFTSDMRQSKTLLTIDEPQGGGGGGTLNLLYIVSADHFLGFRIMNFNIFLGGGWGWWGSEK